MQKISSFQQVIETVEALSLDNQIALIKLLQHRLKHQRRQTLLQQVAEAEADYAAGDIHRGNIADLMALDNQCK